MERDRQTYKVTWLFFLRMRLLASPFGLAISYDGSYWLRHSQLVRLLAVIPYVTSRCNSIDVRKVELYKAETFWPVASYQNRNNYCVTSKKDEQVRSIPSRAGFS
jgi:hypothetical protein